MKNCTICKQEDRQTPAIYRAGFIWYSNKRKIEYPEADTHLCAEHVETCLEQMRSMTFGTRYWPAVADLNGRLVFHGYRDADQEGLSTILGWREKQEAMEAT